MITLHYDQKLSQPLTWAGGKNEHGRTALAKCGNGHISSLSGHTIDDKGHVTPSLVCPYDECNWHEVVTLEGWNNGQDGA
jgi:hypothetical protein